MLKSGLFIVALGLAGATCAEPGGRSGDNQLVTMADGSDAEVGVADSEASEVAETTAPADTAIVDTVQPETTTPDTTAPEAETVGCGESCLPVSLIGAPTGVVFQQHATGPWPTLAGGDAPLGSWELEAVDFYTAETFTFGISVTFSNNGATAGRIELTGDAMAMALDLDMEVTVSAFGSTGSDSARSVLSLGGCHDVSGSRLVGDFGDCASGLSATGQGTMDFEHGAGRLSIGVEISREDLIALLPPEQQESADFAIAGPMYLVSRFVTP